MALTREQRLVETAITQGRNVFFTGGAGTGKSFLLRRLAAGLPAEGLVLTASTAAAACLLGGTTLHQFAGVGIADGSLTKLIALASLPRSRARWMRAKVPCPPANPITQLSITHHRAFELDHLPRVRYWWSMRSRWWTPSFSKRSTR